MEVDCRASAGNPGKGAEVERAKKRPVGDLNRFKMRQVGVGKFQLQTMKLSGDTIGQLPIFWGEFRVDLRLLSLVALSNCPGCATSHCCHGQSDTKPFWFAADVGAATDFWLDLRSLVAGLEEQLHHLLQATYLLKSLC